MSSCTTPGYLPKIDSIDIDPYGAYIDIKPHTGPNIKGELIAIDSSLIVVLTKNKDAWTAVPLSVDNIKSFKLSYARNKDYGWTIPVFTLATISHGLFLIITAPINLIVTTSVAIGSKKSFQYTDKTMSLRKLKMFARFPQGIPPTIDFKDITYLGQITVQA